MMPRHYSIHLDTLDPLTNLSVEELVADSIGNDESVFMLYTNAKAVVIGKNQIPWLETDPDWLLAQKIPLLRRISGGGTVWHDEGNLCYSFIYKKDTRAAVENHDFLIKALNELGIVLTRNDRGDLLLGGRKCSGNALSHRRGMTIHHGTLLIKSDLSLLKQALKPLDLSEFHIQKSGIESLRVEVTQIGDHYQSLTQKQIAEVLIDSWSAKNKSEKYNLDTLLAEKSHGFDKIVHRHRSWDWVFGRSPEFIVQSLDKKFTVIEGFVEKTTQFDQWIRLQKR